MRWLFCMLCCEMNFAFSVLIYIATHSTISYFIALDIIHCLILEIERKAENNVSLNMNTRYNKIRHISHNPTVSGPMFKERSSCVNEAEPAAARTNRRCCTRYRAQQLEPSLFLQPPKKWPDALRYLYKRRQRRSKREQKNYLKCQTRRVYAHSYFELRFFIPRLWRRCHTQVQRIEHTMCRSLGKNRSFRIVFLGPSPARLHCIPV